MGEYHDFTQKAEKLVEGWGLPAAARKAHYFEAGGIISLCGGWLFSGYRPEEVDDRNKCKACIRLSSKLSE